MSDGETAKRVAHAAAMPALTVHQLAAALQVSTSKLSRLTREGRIPCLRIGRAVRYELEPVKTALRLAVAPMQMRPVRAVHRPARQLLGAKPATERWILDERKRIKAERKAQDNKAEFKAEQHTRQERRNTSP